MFVFAYLEMRDVVLDEHLGVGDVLARADEHEGHEPLLARRRRLRLVVALHLGLHHIKLCKLQ